MLTSIIWIKVVSTRLLYCKNIKFPFAIDKHFVSRLNFCCLHLFICICNDSYALHWNIIQYSQAVLQIVPCLDSGGPIPVEETHTRD